ECRSPKDTRRNGAAKPQRRSVLVETSTSNALVSQCDGLGYNSQVFTHAMFDCDAYLSSGSDESLPPSPIYDSLVLLSLTKTCLTPIDPRHLIIEDWVSDLEDEFETKLPQNVHSFIQSTEQVKYPRPSIQHVETSILTANPKTVILKPTSNSKRRNRKACFVCKSLDHLIKDCDYHEKKMAQPTTRNHAKRGTHKQYAQMTLLNHQRHVVPAAVLTQSNLVPITAVSPVTTDVPNINVTRPRQANTVVTKLNSPPRRHINHNPSPKSSTFHLKVTAVKAPMVNAAKDEFNGGYVAFGGNPKGGKISGNGKIRTGNLDFDDVYFVKELKFNLFSVSQMCDKKNSVLFTDTKCLVLPPEFKLPDKNQVLLRVPRENNMYNVNLKNIVPFGDLTCLFQRQP
nr:ribonuclease H-like domain-containing protein [Tanacetum cinerariifolium]